MLYIVLGITPLRGDLLFYFRAKLSNFKYLFSHYFENCFNLALKIKTKKPYTIPIFCGFPVVYTLIQYGYFPKNFFYKFFLLTFVLIEAYTKNINRYDKTDKLNFSKVLNVVGIK